MARKEQDMKEILGHLDPRKIADGKLADSLVVTLEFMKIQGRVGYEIAKKQAIATATTASSIGIGWSAFFFGFVQGSWLTSSLGLMLVFAGTYFLAYWTPKVMNRLKRNLDESEAAKFYSKWVPDQGGPTASDAPR